MTTVTYALPTASASILGGIKVGTGLAISGAGVLSNTGSATTDASQLTSGTLNNARLASNVAILDKTFQTWSTELTFTSDIVMNSVASIATSLQIINNTTTGGGICVGSNSVVSAGAGIIGPALACVQSTPLTSNYGLISIGSASFNGTSPGFFAGSSNGTKIAINAGSGFTGNYLDFQLAGTSKVSINAAGNASLSGSMTGPILQANNTSTIGSGVAIGSTTIASAGAGKIAPALSIVQVPPTTLNYGLISLGTGLFDGVTGGTFNGSSSGTFFAINAAAGFTGNLIDVQLTGDSRFSVTYSGDILAHGGVGTVYAGTLRGSFGTTITSTNNLATSDLLTIGSLGNITGSTGITQCGIVLTYPVLQTGTAGYTALKINAVETSTGSGTKLLADFQVGGTTKFNVSDTGALSVVLSSTTTAPSAGAGNALPATPQGYVTVTINGTPRQIAYY